MRLSSLSSSPLISPLFWLAAFVCALYPLNTWQLWFMAGAVILSLFWSYGRLSRAMKEGAVLPRGGLVVVMLLFWLVMMVSAALSEIPWISYLAVFFSGALPLTFLTLSVAPFSADEWRVVRIGIAAIAAVLSVWAMIQFFFFNEFFDGRAKHPLADPNSLAALFNLILFCALGAFFYTRQKVEKILTAGLILLLLGGLMATGSRGGFFALMGGLVLTAFLCRAFVWQTRKWWLALMAAAALIFSLSAVGSYSQERLVQRVAMTIGLQDGEVAGSRLNTYRSAWELVKDHWLTGTGIGTFYLYYPAYRTPQEIDLITHVHSDPLQFWAEMGIVAPVLFYAFLILAALATRRRAKALAADDPARLRLLFPFIALAVLAAHSHINLNLYNLSILLMAGLVLGWWYQELDLPRSQMRLAYTKTRQALFALVVTVPLVIYGCMIASEHYTAKARDAMMRGVGGLDEYGLNMLLADKVGFHSNPNVYLLAVNIPLVLLQHNLPDMEADKVTAEAAQINNNIDQALKRNPLMSSAWYYKGMLAQLVPASSLPDDMPPPKTSYERAIQLDPMHIGARVALIDLALQENEVDKAKALYEYVDLFRFHTEAVRELYNRALLIYTLTQEREKADLIVERIREFDGRSQDSFARLGKTPWEWHKARSFPQKVDSEKE